MKPIARSRMTRKVRLAMSLALIASTLLWTVFFVRPPVHVYAEAFTVDSSEDEPDENKGDGVCKTATNTCTLRAAIEEADSFDGTHTITIPAGTYTLKRGHIEISKGMTIAGAGAASTIIDADNTSRIFYIHDASTKVAISNVTLTRGKAKPEDHEGSGGAIYSSSSTLEMNNAAITKSNGSYGGALLNEEGTVTFDNVTFSDNKATNEGGALHNFGTGAQMTLKNTTVQNNEAGASGGGILADKTTQVTIQQNSAIIGNKVINRDGEGGGVFVYGTVTIANSRIVSNQATASKCSGCYGGGISVDEVGILTVSQSVIESNTAYHLGGGVYNVGKTTITDSKIGYNRTIYNSGGGLYNDSAPSGANTYGMTIRTTDIYSNTADFKKDGTWTGYGDYVNTFRANGGGLANDTNGSVLVENSSFRFNTSYTEGGAVMNRGNKARFTNVSFTDNKALGAYVKFPWYNIPKWNSEGGAFHSESADTVLTNCEILRNTSTNAGGAIANKLNLKIHNSVIADNKVTKPNSNSSASGGAIDTYYGTGANDLLEIKNSLIRNNSADATGGAINGTSAQFKIYDSAIISNTAQAEGGAIYANVRGGHYRTRYELYNVTLSNNESGKSGGAIYNDLSNDHKSTDSPSRMQLTNVTIVNNRAATGGIGGIQNQHNKDNNTWIKNSIIANNTVNGAPSNCGGSVAMTSQNYNISNDGCGWLNKAQDKINTDPVLGNLADNGGSTYTHALLPGSPAYDYIPSASTVQSTDQRGKSRTGANSDVGAFEAQPPTARDDSVSVQKGSDINNIPVLANDTSDPTGYLKVDTVTIVNNPNFKASANADGTVNYTSSSLNEGNYTFTYSVKDQRSPALTSNTATVTVAVTANTHPTLTDFTKTGNEDTTVSFTTNDFQSKYSDADPMVKVKIVSLPANGTLKLNDATVEAEQEIQPAQLANLTFTPDTHWNGTTEFKWNAADMFNYADSDAKVTITISSVNDVPTLEDVGKSVDEDTTLTMAKDDFTAKFSDPDGTLAKVKMTSLPEHGTLKLSGNSVSVGQEINDPNDLGTLTFTPEPNWHGVTSFGWNGSDGESYAENDKLVIITVNSVEDKPVLTGFSKTGPEDNPILFADTDFTNHFSDADEGDKLKKVKITSLPNNGTLKVGTADVTVDQEIDAANIGKLSFVPTADWFGSTSFNWNASDGKDYATSDVVANITITDVNDTPPAETIVLDIVKSIDEDSQVAFTTNDFSSKYLDSNSDPLVKIQVTSLPTGTLALKSGNVNVPVGVNQEINATALGNLVYIPDPDWNGTAEFTWTGSDGTEYATNSAKVQIIVNAVNDPPVTKDDFNSTKVDDPLGVSARDGVLSNDRDPEGGILVVETYDITSTLGSAVRVNSTGSYDYNPTVSETLSNTLATQSSIIDTFTYVAQDTDGLTATGTVSITVFAKSANQQDVQGPIQTATAQAKTATAVAIQQQTATIQTATAVVVNATATAQTATVVQQTSEAQQQTATVVQQTSEAQQQTATVVQQTSVAQQTATAVQQTATAVQLPTVTVMASPTVTVTASPTVTVTASPTVTVTASPTVTVTASPTVTVTASPTASPTITPTVTPGGQPTLEVNFSTGKPGSTFIFTATNFPAGSKGIITINGEKLGEVTIGNNGTVQFIIVTTGSPVGTYTVKVTVNTETSLAKLYEADTTIQLAESAEMRDAAGIHAPEFRTVGSSQNSKLVYLPIIQRPVFGP